MASCNQVEAARSRDSGDLARRARAGDRAAFDTLARHFRPSLVVTAFLRTGDREAAEDLAQEILLNAWSHLPSLEEPEAFVSWLKAIAANACRSWFRARRPWPESLDVDSDRSAFEDPGPMPLEAVLKKEQQSELRAALMTLPYANRQALLLHVWGDYSYEEIAAFTAVRLSTVEGRIYRARQHLRRLLRDRGAGFLGEPRRRWKAPSTTVSGPDHDSHAE